MNLVFRRARPQSLIAIIMNPPKKSRKLKNRSNFSRRISMTFEISSKTKRKRAKKLKKVERRT